MKRIALLALLLFALPLFAADPPKKDDDTSSNENRALKSRIFEIHNRAENEILDAVRLLGSGAHGAAMMVNRDLHTLTVRDFPENLAAVEDALKRLDHAETTPNISLRIAILIGSKTPLPGAASVPEDLEPVVKQLQSTLRYSNYGLLASTMHRTKPGNGIENSGVAEPALVGMTAHEGKPILYSYRLRQITAGTETISVETFSFSMKVPIDIGNGVTQYQDVGFNTPVSIRQNEKVVIGTTTMGDKALIVVVTATAEVPAR
jgi:hypothetical protein